ncbi:MAG: hypothetical protein KKI08_17345 [Armatimonadetes bacterium]|nr:hypothetical protein [Armatimonadota bacterium]
MRKYMLVLTVALMVAVVVGGCGGGAEALLRWVRYSPPAEVIPPEDLQFMAAQAVVGIPVAADDLMAGDLGLFAFGDIPALRNLLFELIAALADQLGGILPRQAPGPRTDAQLVALMKQVVTAQGVRTQQVEQPDPFFDWTDPETGVHWTGQVLEQDGRLLPQLHGVGPETNCVVNLQLLFELGSRLEVSGSISGPIVAEVYYAEPRVAGMQTTPGRAILDAALNILVNVIAGGDTSLAANTHLAGEFQVPNGAGWKTVSQGETTLQVNGSLNDAPQLDVSGTIRRGTLLGEGLYWWQHAFTASMVLGGVPEILAAQADPAENQLTFDDDITFSDGMSGALNITLTDDDLTFGGVLRAPNGTVLGTIDLGPDGEGPPMIHWVDGSTDELI